MEIIIGAFFILGMITIWGFIFVMQRVGQLERSMEFRNDRICNRLDQIQRDIQRISK